jgi:hypothetical protein
VIFPAVVEKSDAPVESAMNDVDRGALVSCLADVVPAQAKRRNLYVSMFPEGPHRNCGGRI